MAAHASCATSAREAFSHARGNCRIDFDLGAAHAFWPRRRAPFPERDRLDRICRDMPDPSRADCGDGHRVGSPLARGRRLLDRFARLLGRAWTDKTAAGAATLLAELHDIYRRRARVWVSFVLHLVCWIASALEAWIALRLAGAALGFPVVLVIEGLLYAARSAAFAVPNAVGVQEGAYVLLGAGLGLTPEMGLALSLLKRWRDLAIGLPPLATWQFLEGGRLWASRRRVFTAPPAALKTKTPAVTAGVSAPPARCDSGAMSIVD
jgi:hypothetical protein